jgi:hypothetical protein
VVPKEKDAATVEVEAAAVKEGEAQQREGLPEAHGILGLSLMFPSPAHLYHQRRWQTVLHLHPVVRQIGEEEASEAADAPATAEHQSLDRTAHLGATSPQRQTTPSLKLVRLSLS